MISLFNKNKNVNKNAYFKNNTLHNILHKTLLYRKCISLFKLAFVHTIQFIIRTYHINMNSDNWITGPDIMTKGFFRWRVIQKNVFKRNVHIKFLLIAINCYEIFYYFRCNNDKIWIDHTGSKMHCFISGEVKSMGWGLFMTKDFFKPIFMMWMWAEVKTGRMKRSDR